MARCSKRDLIEKNRQNIENWLASGNSINSICKTLGVSKGTFYKYFNLDDSDAVKNARQPAIQKLEDTMYRTALGFKETVQKGMKVKKAEYKDGKKVREWEDVVPYFEDVFIKPDVVAGIFLLKNWAGYMNEPQAIKLKEKEVKLKEEKQENDLW